MSFKEFENALELLASNKGVSGDKLRQQVAASAGPLCNATQAAAVRLHDDRSTYTGQWWSGSSIRLEGKMYVGIVQASMGILHFHWLIYSQQFLQEYTPKVVQL